MKKKALVKKAPELSGRKVISDLMPSEGTLLLTGSGKEYVKKVGEELIREAVIGVLCGKNLRSQTEFLTRSRISQITAAMIVLYWKGKLQVERFSESLPGLAVEQLRASRRNSPATAWPAQWFLGLTGKSVQNVLKGDHAILDNYVEQLQQTIGAAVDAAKKEYGELHGQIKFVGGGVDGGTVNLNWLDFLQLTTAIGAQNLTIRGSDKSMYGKLFEKLVLGTVLTMLGYKRVSVPSNVEGSGVFWLSDGSNTRESDATLLHKPGHLIRFDMGFIGPGNSEISKDKLSRFSTEQNHLGYKTYTKTIIVVDRLPNTSKTLNAAKEIDAEIIQMSMKYWPRNLAIALSKTTNKSYPIQSMTDAAIETYIAKTVSGISMANFLESVSLQEIEEDTSE